MEKPNLSYIYDMAAGDKAFENKLIEVIQQEFPEEKKEYYHSLKLKNFKNTASCVHKLKNKISILGLTNGYEIASNFENNLLNQNTKGVNEFENVLQSMTNFLKNL